MERDIKPTYDELESYIDRLDRQRADAQATIAALQARVQELEQWVQDQSTANLETMRHMDEMQSRALEAESQLTQRTAALEAAQRERDEAAKDRDDWITSWRALQRHNERIEAELERVRGELQKAERCISEWVDRHSTYFSKLEIDFAKLHALVAALPKVEGEINERFCTGSYYSSPRDYRTHVTFEAALVALLKHRQGMEG